MYSIFEFDCPYTSPAEKHHKIPKLHPTFMPEIYVFDRVGGAGHHGENTSFNYFRIVEWRRQWQNIFSGCDVDPAPYFSNPANRSSVIGAGDLTTAASQTRSF